MLDANDPRRNNCLSACHSENSSFLILVAGLFHTEDMSRLVMYVVINSRHLVDLSLLKVDGDYLSNSDTMNISKTKLIIYVVCAIACTTENIILFW